MPEEQTHEDPTETCTGDRNNSFGEEEWRQRSPVGRADGLERRPGR